MSSALQYLVPREFAGSQGDTNVVRMSPWRPDYSTGAQAESLSSITTRLPLENLPESLPWLLAYFGHIETHPYGFSHIVHTHENIPSPSGGRRRWLDGRLYLTISTCGSLLRGDV